MALPIHIRYATDDDAPHLAELAAANGYTVEGVEWKDIYPFWLAAERDGEIVGALNLIAAKPIGWLEMLMLGEGVGRHARGRIVKALVERGCALLAGFGANVAMGSVPDELRSYITVLEHRGGVVTNRSVMVAKRLS